MLGLTQSRCRTGRGSTAALRPTFATRPRVQLVRIAIVGVGTMGGAVLAGLARTAEGGYEVLAGVRRPERGEELAAQYGVAHGPATEVAGRFGQSEGGGYGTWRSVSPM